MLTSSSNNSFSIGKRIMSFRFALDGIASFFKQEHNSRIHFFASVAAITVALILHCSKSEFIFIVLAIGFVWAAELFNTAIENLSDLITKENNTQIKLIKDLSAGAVLIAAVSAFIIGCIIFIPKIF